MQLDDLYHEVCRVQLRLDFDDKPTAWMLERLQALRYAIALRRRGPSGTFNVSRGTWCLK